jgi:hypothetical protein
MLYQLSYSRKTLVRHCGGRWIRTIEGVKPADLQSAPFGRSGIPPKNENLRLHGDFF